eukprot:scaffold5756_cov69-Skeletonema_dohrnii-CCMP3373.AAC.4
MASATIADRPRLWRSMLLFMALVCCSLVVCMHEKLIVFSHAEDQEQTAERTKPMMRRRLSDDVNHDMDLEHVLHLATRAAEDTFTEDPSPFRVLFIVTTLSEYDKGTRGTVNGAD